MKSRSNMLAILASAAVASLTVDQPAASRASQRLYDLPKRHDKQWYKRFDKQAKKRFR